MFLFPKHTVLILIIATSSMLKSTLSTNISENTHFGQKYQKKIFLEFSGDYTGVCLRHFQRIERKLDNAFGLIFNFLDNFVTLKNSLWNLIPSIDTSDVSVAPDIICQHKTFQKLF